MQINLILMKDAKVTLCCMKYFVPEYTGIIKADIYYVILYVNDNSSIVSETLLLIDTLLKLYLCIVYNISVFLGWVEFQTLNGNVCF